MKIKYVGKAIVIVIYPLCTGCSGPHIVGVYIHVRIGIHDADQLQESIFCLIPMIVLPR